jgi:hypothetical protein
MELIVDDQLIEASIEQEIRHFFYADKRNFKHKIKSHIAKNKNSKAKNKKYKGARYANFMKTFKQIQLSHPEIFLK